jgi:hypothetical protein
MVTSAMRRQAALDAIAAVPADWLRSQWHGISHGPGPPPLRNV